MAGEKTAGKMALSTPVKVAAGVVLGALLIIVASKMMRMRQRNYSPQVIQQIESLARYAQANSAMAGQDTHLVISLMHVTKALTSAEVARRLVDPADIIRLTGININDIVDTLEQQQQQIIHQMSMVCPILAVNAPGGMGPVSPPAPGLM